MAEALSEEQPLVEHPAAGRASPAFRGRFRLAYAALALSLWAAVALLAVVLARDGPARQRPWSAWEPHAGSSIDRAGEIAAHLAPLYRTADGAQLVGIQAHLPEVQNQPRNVPVEAIAVRGGLGGREIRVDPTSKAVFYLLCGLGKECAIDGGVASAARAALLRREALELALYTFEYDAADSVVAFLPPATDAAGSSVGWAIYFERADLDRALSRPLAATLPAHARLTPSALGRAERDLVERLTTSRAYATSFTAAQDGGAVLVLDPLARSR